MDLLHLISWYDQGISSELDARIFYARLQKGIKNGCTFPINCPYQVGLVYCSVDPHWCVGILVLSGTEHDDTAEQSAILTAWYAKCEADHADTEKNISKMSNPSVAETLKSRFGSHYECIEVFGPL